MASNASVYQQTRTVSVPREDFMEYIVKNRNLSETDLRVALLLLTQLDGWKYRPRQSDPCNFKKVDAEEMSRTLDISKKKVKRSLEVLENECIIEKGGTSTTKNGYRFTF